MDVRKAFEQFDLAGDTGLKELNAIEVNASDIDYDIDDDSDKAGNIFPVLNVISAFFNHDLEVATATQTDASIESRTDRTDDTEEASTTLEPFVEAFTVKSTIPIEDIKTNEVKEPEENQHKALKARKAKLFRDGKAFDIPGGLDFSNAVFDETVGKLCMAKEEEIETVEKTPILECNHK